MKKVIAYIQPFMLQKVTDALHQIHIRGMSVSEIKGFGKEKDESYPHHTKEHLLEFTPKTRIEIICKDEESEDMIRTIKKNARTGRKGDGKIIITNVEKVCSIRTNSCDDEAL